MKRSTAQKERNLVKDVASIAVYSQLFNYWPMYRTEPALLPLLHAEYDSQKLLMCCISMNSSGFFPLLFPPVGKQNSRIIIRMSVFSLLLNISEMTQLAGGNMYSGERILGYRNGQDTFSNMFCFQVLWKILGNAKWVTVAGVVKDLESRNMYHLQCRILNRNPTDYQGWGKALAVAFCSASLLLGFSLDLQILFGEVLHDDTL